ncbi:MAG: cell division protein ZapD [Panacagrimonas sp.]
MPQPDPRVTIAARPATRRGLSLRRQTINFEQPLNERTRTFLRLEFLFTQHEHHRQDLSIFGARARLQALLDILMVLGRSDLKKEVLKDLGEQQAVLTRLVNRPGVDNARLQTVLEEIAGCIVALQQQAGQFASMALRENEFLMAVLNRITIPGGTCGFDLPALHWWLSQAPEQVAHDLDQWFHDLLPFAHAILLDLRLLRGSVGTTDALAYGGNYVHTLQGACSLIRVFVPESAGAYPEISAGSHRFTIRFMDMQGVGARATQAHRDVRFKLQCCAL